MQNLLIAVVFSSLVLIAGCSSSIPEPPTVDGSEKISINSKNTNEYLALKADLEQLKTEVALQPKVVTVIAEKEENEEVDNKPSSRTIFVTFPYNNSTLNLSSEKKAELLPFIHEAKRIELRGRTDGKRATTGDEKVALNRALSAKRYLIGQGVPAQIISINYLSASDYLNENLSARNRQENRRVEIELFN